MREAHKGDLLGDDPKAAFGAIVDTAVGAAEGFDDLERTVHCSFGDYSAKDYLAQITSFRGFAPTTSRVIGTDPTLPPELVQGLWDLLSPVADEWRTYGVFGAAVPVADDAPAPSTACIGLTGRDRDERVRRADGGVSGRRPTRAARWSR